MAISDDRLGLESISKITVNNFSSYSDTSKLLNAESLSSITTDEVSMLDPVLRLGSNAISGTLGVFEEGLCTALEALDIKLPKFQTNLLRDLNKDFSNLISSLKPNINLSDYKISTNGCSNANAQKKLDSLYNSVKSLSLPKSLLNANYETALDNLISNNLSTTLSGLGLSSATLASITSKIKSNIVSITGVSGLTVNEKLALQKLLANAGTSTSNIASTSSTVNKITTSATLTALMDTDSSLASKYVNNLLSSSTVDRSTVLSAIAYSISNSNNTTVNDKLSLMQEVMATTTPETSVSDTLSTRIDTSSLLNTLNTDSTVTMTPSADYDTLVSSLDMLSPSWNVDSLGNTNYSSVSNNASIADLSNKKLLDTSMDMTVLESGETSTTLNSASTISILNAFSSSKPTINCGCA